MSEVCFLSEEAAVAVFGLMENEFCHNSRFNVLEI